MWRKEKCQLGSVWCSRSTAWVPTLRIPRLSRRGHLQKTRPRWIHSSKPASSVLFMSTQNPSHVPRPVKGFHMIPWSKLRAVSRPSRRVSKATWLSTPVLWCGRTGCLSTKLTVLLMSPAGCTWMGHFWATSSCSSHPHVPHVLKTAPLLSWENDPGHCAEVTDLPSVHRSVPHI